ncbi:MAG: helix-turn-helix transcriptional regulator [Rikenellaceae bacterium]|mgnify:CR=1 FL=1|jgi:AraC-like DNA-binding protein|nr:helix-turn-helix transcriptional regulator [Rikenellaceae bacterium]
MKEVLTEITPLSQKDFFFIVDRHKTRFTFPVHKHSEYEINFVEHCFGAKRVVGDSVEKVGEYELVLIGGGLEHFWEQAECKSPDMREITIQFEAGVFPESFSDKIQFRDINIMLERAKYGLAFSNAAILKSYSILDTLAAEQDRFEQLLNFFRLLNILAKDSRARELSSVSFAKEREPEEEERIMKVKKFIHEHFTEEITLAQVADVAGMSASSFSRYFHLATGRTLRDYLIDSRLGKASRLLMSTDLNISEICYSCGFNNLSNFNRIFKSRRGSTPREFRKMYKHNRVLV